MLLLFSRKLIPIFRLVTVLIYSGSSTLDTNPLYNNASANLIVATSYTQTISNTAITSYFAVSSLQTLSYDISASGLFNLTTYICSDPVTPGIDFCLLSGSLSSLSQLILRYLILSAAFTKITHFYGSASYFVQNGGSTEYDVANPIINNFGIPPINIATTARVFTFLNGFNATAPNNTYAFDLQMSASYPTNGSLRV